MLYNNVCAWKMYRASNDFHFFFQNNAPLRRSSYNTMNNMGDIMLHVVYILFIHNNIIIIL